MLRFAAGGYAARFQGVDGVKAFAFLLLLAGWGLVIAALALLSREAPRDVFIVAGLAVEAMGLVMVIRAHPAARGEED
jgi:uncharacterized membrane protein